MIWGEIPEEVRRVFADNDIWWQKGQKSTMQQFLSQYTLHDAYWHTIDYEHGGLLSAVLLLDIFHIDPNRHKLELPIQDENMIGPFYSGEWPYLCIRFSNVHQIVSDHSEKYVDNDVIDAASTRMLADDERLEWLDSIVKLTLFNDDIGDFLLSKSVHITTFVGTARNHLHVIHNEPTYFLCVNDDGTILHLPSLDLIDEPD